MLNDEAILSSDERYTIFKFQDRTIRFACPYSLERYTRINKWEHGYIEVMAKYSHNETDEEEYIDLIPVLKNLYMDADEFLEPIKKVRVYYD